MAAEFFWESLRHRKNDKAIVALSKHAHSEDGLSMLHTFGDVHATQKAFGRRCSGHASGRLRQKSIKVRKPIIADRARLSTDPNTATSMP